MNLSLVDMPQGPVVKPHLHQVGDRAGRIEVVPCSTGQRRVKHRDVDRSRLRRPEFRQQTVRSVLVAEADAMDPDIGCKLHLTAPPIKDMHIGRQVNLAGDRVFCVVIAFYVKHADARPTQSFHLQGQVGRGLCAALGSVVKIARNQERRHTFGNAEIHHLF
ncbi:hypothetical protein GALL_483150 [mine drainage metagenome]|uniref:Uncharacterized protein n=1 Tax=mine drainage metagenome TaxID=410659 RepID=A0A1J5PFC2_9ZZZZ